MIREREYLCSVDRFNKPVVYNEKKAIATLLIRLILLEPGSDPLHPEMGVGIKRYRYSMNTLDQLKQRVKEQIETFLPCFRASNVELTITDNHLCNIEITIDDTIYVYDSNEAPLPIRIDDMR